jgi:hypothetical protein
MESMGTPRAASSVASSARASAARRARMAGSRVGPSAPLFQEWLASLPSRLSSPLAALCLRAWLTRSASVKPSCAVTKFTLSPGRPGSASLDPARRVASAPVMPASPRQKRRMSSRKRSFHSPQPGGKAPR